jgi:hypothetical protein
MSGGDTFGIGPALDEESVLSRLRALGPSAIGLATELFVETGWPELVARASAWSRAALELSALTAAELDGVVAYLEHSSPPIRYLSLHAPLVLVDGGEQSLVARLSEVESRVAAVIQHPHILAEPALLAPLGKRLLLENMDAQKPGGRLVAELEPYFRSLPKAGFCLDVAHVASVDPEMKLGRDLLDAFGARLRELHISGMDAECTHVPLDADSVARYAPILRRCRHVPWILESLPADVPIDIVSPR